MKFQLAIYICLLLLASAVARCPSQKNVIYCQICFIFSQFVLDHMTWELADAIEYGINQCLSFGFIYSGSCQLIIRNNGERIYNGVHNGDALNKVCDFVC
ncbi:unnamed protein product [Enterobius vermicularis]|uniref:Saposin B-type domain-containing protein n=1 Tax=Enterobius vermicularis TaxID=51028 RepID=A0A0N4V194_ENTVE|nr:unnamed protein product [Enterobius vermicularis]